ncbi:FecCD family ABC transporter permease [Metabacillus malikii]|nr:iron ABC transporter permease [Metabacillus malikii]
MHDKEVKSSIIYKNSIIGISLFIAGIFLLLLSIILSIHFGAANLSYKDVLDAMFAFNPDNPSHVIIRELRLPRAIAAVTIGASLAVSGSIMQGMTRNPLASPSIMGVTAGASFLIAIALAIIPGISYIGLMSFSLLGAGLGAGLVFGISSLSKGGVTPVKLALAGSAITTLLSSLSTALGLKFNISKDISFWFVGGFSSVQPQHITFALPFILCGLVCALFLARSITTLSLGDDVAKGLGQNINLVKLFGTLVVLLLTGAAVSIAGMIGFIGLVVPHITRFLVGTDYRRIIPFSAILGGLLLIFADIIGRLVNAPFETPVGAITAIIGVPFFLYLARKEGRGL